MVAKKNILGSAPFVFLAFLSCLFLVRVESQLYLLSIALAMVGWAVWREFIAGDGADLKIISVHGSGPLLAVVTISALLVNCLTSTMPMTSRWFAWIIGLVPLSYLVWVKASTPRGWDWLFSGLVAVGVLVSIWAAIEFILTSGHRADGPFIDYNAFAALLYVLIIPVVAELALAGDGSRGVRRGMLSVVLGLLFLAFFMAMSRAGTAILLLLLPLVLACLGRAGVPVKRTSGLVAGLAAATYLIVKIFPSDLKFRTLDLANDASAQARLDMWKSAWRAWRDHPWTGTGLGTYRMQYLHYRVQSEQASSGDLAHNDYVQLLMEGGPWLLAVIVVAAAACLWLSWKLWRQAGNKGVSSDARIKGALGFSLAAAISGLFVHAGVNFIFYVAPLSVLAGLYLAQAQVSLSPVRIRKTQLPVRRGVGNFAFMLLGIWVVGGLLLDWVISEVFDPNARWQSAIEIQNEPFRRYKVATAFLALRPDQVEAREAATIAAINLAIAQRNSSAGVAWSRIALSEGKAWLKYSQGNPFVYSAVGQLLWRFPDLKGDMSPEFSEKPDVVLAKAIDRYPAFAGNYNILSRYYREHGQDVAALVVLWEGMQWLGFTVDASSDVAGDWGDLINQGIALARKMENRSLGGVAREARDGFISFAAKNAAK